MKNSDRMPFKDSYKNLDRTFVALSVYNTGRQKCTPMYQWGPGIRDHYLIHYIISGQGWYETRDARYHLKAGDVFLAFPHTPMTYYAHQDDPWEYCWVGFNGSDALSIVLAAGFTKKSPVIFQFPRGDLLEDRISQIYQCHGSDQAHSLEMTGKLYSALALLVENAPDTAHGAQDTYVQKAMEYINGHFAYPVSVEEIACYTGISRSQLYRAFQQQLHMSPKEYLTRFRIRQACRLLKNTDLPVSTIAGSAGFDNSLYFSRVFKKAMGQSPSQYRKA